MCLHTVCRGRAGRAGVSRARAAGHEAGQPGLWWCHRRDQGKRHGKYHRRRIYKPSSLHVEKKQEKAPRMLAVVSSLGDCETISVKVPFTETQTRRWFARTKSQALCLHHYLYLHLSFNRKGSGTHGEIC